MQGKYLITTVIGLLHQMEKNTKPFGEMLRFWKTNFLELQQTEIHQTGLQK